MRLPKVINSFNQITAERSHFYVWRICYCSTKMKAGILTGTRAFICFICGMIQWDGYIVTLTISCHAPFVWLHNVTQLLEIFMAMISNYSYTHILEQKSNNTSKFDKFFVYLLELKPMSEFDLILWILFRIVASFILIHMETKRITACLFCIRKAWSQFQRYRSITIFYKA